MPKDLFSQQAAHYSKWRPTYPPELIEYIVSFVPERKLALDCATGNGQAALLLAEHFEEVIATDLSNEQLKYAKPHPKIAYKQGPAEHTDFAENTFDLITVAQAYHWFDHKAFCQEAHRICKPGGVVAIWGYDLCFAQDPAVTNLIVHFYKDITGPYWDEGRKYIDDNYKTVYFDFKEIPVTKTFSIRTTWTIHDLQGFLNSWSAVQKYIKVNGHDPVEPFIRELNTIWSEDRRMEFQFPIFMRMGRS
jgi:ubiquinone/menaquinone biosynthesis C-methylase UbiE